MLGLAGTGLLTSLVSEDNVPSPLEMPLWSGFCSFLCGREENGEKGKQEMNLTHPRGGEAEIAVLYSSQLGDLDARREAAISLLHLL